MLLILILGPGSTRALSIAAVEFPTSVDSRQHERTESSGHRDGTILAERHLF
jgi:hypothetical protein